LRPDRGNNSNNCSTTAREKPQINFAAIQNTESEKPQLGLGSGNGDWVSWVGELGDWDWGIGLRAQQVASDGYKRRDRKIERGWGAARIQEPGARSQGQGLHVAFYFNKDF